jgi:8-amino-7-oxononanoate synthase
MNYSISLQTMLEDAQRMDVMLHQKRTLTKSMCDGVMVTQHGKTYLSFCSNDYLGLRNNPPQQQVTGAGASRLVTGNHPAYARLEALLAMMKGTEAALVFGSGYLANLGTIPALVGKGDLVLMDRFSHACMIDGVRLSEARWMRYRHNDMEHLQTLLETHRAKHRYCLILTETVFSMDGDRAPLTEIHRLAEAHDAWLMTDDAHGFGLPAPYPNPAAIQMGTLSKAVGVMGGYVAGSQALIDHLVNHARSVIFSTALPIAVVEASTAALQLMQSELERGERVMRYAAYVTDALILPPAQSAIVPIIIGENEAAFAVQERLKGRGILVSAIRPPTVPNGTARLRVCLSAAHSEAQVTELVEALREITVKR